MSEPKGMSQKAGLRLMKSTLLAGGAAAALFAGFAAAPTLLAERAEAQRITINPPSGAPMSFADLVEQVSPAVVSIQVVQTRGPEGPEELEGRELPPEFEEFLRRFPQARPRESTSLGSGFFIDPRGTLVTNHHVVDNATDITVRLSNEKEYKAEVVGSDELTDIAVLRLKEPGGARFPFVEFDKNATLRVGDWVVAVGNPFGLEGTATAGIVSAMGRRNIGGSSFVDFIQTDAPINRGNSGGPTFDLMGRVVGVNSAIFSPTGGNVGIGFAIPAATADRVVKDLLDSGRVSRGWLGVQVQGLDEDLAKSLGLEKAEGALVAQVFEGGPAAAAGLRQGDLILKVNGEAVDDQSDLTRKVAGAPVGASARFEILRDGRRQTISVKLGERPSEQQLASADGVAPESAGPSGGEARAAALGVAVRPIGPEDRRRLDLSPSETGLIIARVDPDSEMARKAVQPGDAILAAGGTPVRSVDELNAAVAAASQAKRPVLLQIRGRSGPSRFVAIDVASG